LHTPFFWAVVACSLFAPAVMGQNAEPRAKTARTSVSGGRYVKGIVDKIDAEGMTLVEVLPSGETSEYKLVPTDVLREGETPDHVTGRFTHRWQDVKKGDELEVVYNTDHLDKLTYCVRVCILKRPKGKLPAWQKGENPDDKVLFAQLSMFNDLTNGEDVSDDDIKRVFPATPDLKDRYGKVFARAYAGGLPQDYQAKLDAIREKKAKEAKDKELKASPPPPEKK
jgi:hypothetical protein